MLKIWKRKKCEVEENLKNFANIAVPKTGKGSVKWSNREEDRNILAIIGTAHHK